MDKGKQKQKISQRKEKAESVLNDTQEILRQFPEVKCAHYKREVYKIET